MPLPMKLWIALEDDVARHKAELAQAFAQARERLLPEPVSDTERERMYMERQLLGFEMARAGLMGGVYRYALLTLGE